MRHTLLSPPLVEQLTGGIARVVKLTAIAVTLALLPSTAMAQYDDYGYDTYDSYDTDDAGYGGAYDDVYDRDAAYDYDYGYDDYGYGDGYGDTYDYDYPYTDTYGYGDYGYGYDADDAEAYLGYRGLDTGPGYYTDDWFDLDNDFYNWFD